MGTVVETKSCPICSASFDITDADIAFYAKVSPVVGGVTYALPTPTLCPECRQRRRLTWRNQRKLYRRTCEPSGRECVSIYAPDSRYSVYDLSVWWEHGWNVPDTDQAYDFSRSFFEQFAEVDVRIPRPHIHAFNHENCEYVNQTAYSKNCYLAFCSDYSEDCLYTDDVVRGIGLVDCMLATDSEVCYECVGVVGCQFLFFSFACRSCHHGYFLRDCENCHDCIGCVGLVNAQYCVGNESVGREHYEAILRGLDLQDPEVVRQYTDRARALRLSKPVRHMYGLQNENSDGDLLFETRDCHDCYGCERAEGLRYCANISDARDSYDWDYVGYASERCYECVGSGDGMSRTLFGAHLWGHTRDVYYSEFCMDSSNLLGCVGLRHREYCILNRQYTQGEYEALFPRIVEHMRSTGEWGEFFPTTIAPFGYNESVAYEYLPMGREEALARGFRWSDYEAPAPRAAKTLPANRLPARIEDIPDDILSWAIECEVTGKPFRVIARELDFYRKYKLPVPRRHPEERYRDRMRLRNPRKLYARTCAKCGTDIRTTYAPERPERVYCETCYDREIYG